MWSSAVRRGGGIGLSKLGSSAARGSSWRALSAGTYRPPGEGAELEFQTKRYPSFWSRLKQQKHGLGNMALSASIAFLAISIIKQEKELTRANEVAGQLKQQNDALKERLEGLTSVLVTYEAGETTTGDVLALLRDVLDSNGEGLPNSSVKADKPAQTPSRSKFMV